MAVRRRRVLPWVGVLVVVAVAVIGFRLAREWLAVRDVDAHERRWRRERPADYRYDIEVLCFCFGPSRMTVTVDDGRVTDVDPTPTVPPPTIDELFDLAREAIGSGARSVDVEYASDGHPTRLSIDDSAGVADDEVTYRIRELRRP